MTVRAKFFVSKIVDGEEGSTIELVPVTSGSPENESFYKWTPGGNIILSTINPDAVADFELNKQYYVDFTSAE